MGAEPREGPLGLWQPDRDYVNYYPHDRDHPTALSEAIVGSPDLIYVADPYGVHEMDLEIIDGTRIQPTRSPQIFGGLSSADVDVIEEMTSSRARLVRRVQHVLQVVRSLRARSDDDHDR